MTTTHQREPLRYTHAGARMREAIRLTDAESAAMLDLAGFCLGRRERVDVLAAARAVDKLRRGLELYRVTEGGRG